MNSRKRIIPQLNRDAIASSMYALANVISKGISFFTIPVFTRLLSTSEMGITTAFNSMLALLFPVMTLSVTSGTLQIGMAEYKDRRDDYASETLILSSISSLCIGPILFFVLKRWFGEEIGDKLVLCLIVYTFFYASLEIWYTKVRFDHNYGKYALMSITVAVVSTIVSIFCVKCYEGNYKVNLGEIRVLASSGVIVGVSVIIYFSILIKGHFFFSIDWAKRILILSWPMVFHSLSKNILDVSDRLMIMRICTASNAGVYGTIAGYSTILIIIWNAIDTAIVPTIFERLSDDDFASVNRISINALFVFLFITSISTVLLAPLVEVMTVEEYFDGISILPVLLIGNYFVAIYHLYGTLLLFKKKTSLIMIGTMISSGLNILMNLCLLGTYGYHAAAYTTTISFVVQALLQGWICKVVYRENVIDTKQVVILSIVCISVCMIEGCFGNFQPGRLLVLAIPLMMIPRVKKILVN